VYLRKQLGQELDPVKGNDGKMTFGLINGALRTLDASLRHFFGPLVRQQGPAEWGRSSAEGKAEFLVGVDVLAHNLDEALKTLSAGLQLGKPSARLEGMGVVAVAEDPNMVGELVELLDDWCVKVEAYLNDGDRVR
jgi:hypothetical protein